MWAGKVVYLVREDDYVFLIVELKKFDTAAFIISEVRGEKRKKTSYPRYKDP